MNKPDPLSAFRPKLKTSTSRRGRPEKYPWRSMQVLDSFLVPEDEAQPSSVRAMACAKGKDLSRKFSVTAGPGGMWVTREE